MYVVKKVKWDRNLVNSDLEAPPYLEESLQICSSLQLQLELGWSSTGLQNEEMQPGWRCSKSWFIVYCLYLLAETLLWLHILKICYKVLMLRVKVCIFLFGFFSEIVIFLSIYLLIFFPTTMK